MKPEKTILTAGPSVSEKEINYVLDAVKNGWNENWASYLKKFESSLSNYIGVKNSMATSSCTGAMFLALKALGIKKGDEVLVPELTWVATATVVVHTGAKPIFVDVDEKTWTMDPNKIEEKITSKTKAIMPVHLYGHPSKMDQIMEIAKKYNLFIVEDAAPAIGAEFMGKKVGGFGDVGAFSFQGAKMLVTGEGGMVLTDNDTIFNRIQKLGDHGRSRDPQTPFWIEEIGYKFKMTNLQAAFGLAQLERINELIDKKRKIFSWYYKRLRNIEGLELNKEAEWAKSIYWMTSIYLKKKWNITRDELIVKLKEDMIDTRPCFPQISQYPMWPTAYSPVAKHIGDNGINLPSGHNLTEEQIDYICNSIKKHLGI